MSSPANAAATCKCGFCIMTITNPTEAQPPGYCHCNSCRKSHGSPFSLYSQVARTNFQVTGPTTEYHSYKGDWNTYRVRCTDCGSPLYVHLGDKDVFVVMSHFYKDGKLVEGFKPPAHHIWYDLRIVDVKDGLIKKQGWSEPMDQAL
ncbi:UNVERIFIED_CONTAM: hypothetical protein HDU68_004042, partial [Siphonaria sp. JEL0065]